jgi:hypothetical protein
MARTGTVHLPLHTGKALVFVLSLFLMAWEPASVAGELLNAMGTLGMRGFAGGLELAAHAAVAIVAVVAGWSLRTGAPHAPSVAQAALAASALRTVQSLHWSALPHQTMPGEQLPMAVAALLHAAVWILYLRRSRHVRASYT